MGTINVAFICDNNYAMCTGVAIFSLYKNRNADRNNHVYIICNNVSEDNQKLFNKMDTQQFKVEIIDVSDYANYADYEQMKYAKHVSQTALYKFNLPELLPQVEKVLYLDGDVIIRDDLADLYDIDLADNYAAVCKDIGAETFPAPYNQRLGIHHSAYFNSGVMLLNLNRMRIDHISEKLLDYKLHGKNDFMDQDAFNVVFEEQVIYISFLYNMALSCWRKRTNKVLSKYYDIQSPNIEFFYNSAKIIHLSAPEKPWLYFNVPASEEWFLYFIESPFKQIELHRQECSTIGDLITNKYDDTNLKLCRPQIVLTSIPQISVVIPVYNAEKYLNNCIESLLSQTFTEAEFIFVDDGSSDRSVQIIESYQQIDERVKLIKQENLYAGPARNKGMSIARGEYLTFLDSDDMMLPTALEMFYQKAKESKADIVISSAYFFSDNCWKRKVAGWCLCTEFLPLQSTFSAKSFSRYIFQITTGAPWGKFYKTALIRDNGIYFPSVPRSEDFFFVFWALVIANSVTTLQAATVLYRVSPGNGSLEDSKDKFPTASIEVRKMLYEKLTELGIYSLVRQSFINSTLDGVAQNLKTFRSGSAFELFYNIVKQDVIPFYQIDLTNEWYFYNKDNYAFIKEIADSESCAQYLFRKYKDVQGLLQVAQSKLSTRKQPSVQNNIRDVERHNVNREYFYENEVRAIRASWSYKIGRFITWLPRKVRGGIWCYREHGWRYTWGRVLIHLHLKKETLETPVQPSQFNITKVPQTEKRTKIVKDYDYYYSLPSSKYAEELQIWYREKTGDELNLDDPQTYNEKIQWLKLYDSTPIKTRLADKYLVRDWVTEKIGEEYLIPILGVWDSFDEIDFDTLPNQFALKTNHGSGWNYIVKDKSKLNIVVARKKFNQWLSRNFAFVAGFELHYMNIPPKIIAEQYIEEMDQVYDYKFMCFDGVVKFIWVDTDRFTNHKRTLFTPTWKRMEERLLWPTADHEIPKPKNLDKMLEFAEKLSQGFAHVRVDFYEVQGKLYFGEMTFTSSSGTEHAIPKEFEYTMGSWLKLPPKSPIPERKVF